MPKALLISGDSGGARYLAEVLKGGDFQVRHVLQRADALDAIPAWEPDVIIIEMPLPDGEGLSLCRALQEAFNVPIVICSTSGREQDIVRALEAGADDYLAIPVRPVELLARLRAMLRRSGDPDASRPNKDRLVVGDLEVRLDEHRAYRKSRLLDLSPTEFRLLVSLAREAGRPVSHSKLIAQVWGPEYVDCRHYLRLYIRYLRSKMEDDPRDPRLIVSDWGVGYRFHPAQG